MATDIQTTGLIFQSTPRAWHPYIKLARLDRPIGTWLLLLPCLWSLTLSAGSLSSINWAYIALFSLGAVLMRSAGCTINDLWDRKLDAAVERTKARPLPSGEITLRQALVFLSVLLSVSFIILLQFNLFTIGLGVFSLALVATYPLMKRITWWPQLFLGFTFNWGALMGWSAMTGGITLTALLVYTGGIFWTLAYDTIYAHQDKEDDALIGIKSTARLFGKNSRLFVSVFFAAALVFFGMAAWMESNLLPLLIFLPAGHALWQIWTWKIDNPENCLKIFKSNRFFGLLILLMFALVL
jgi:4-hydroxybenzoate polyprenyltransferase